MSETFKYVVQVECEPWPAAYAGEIVQSLRQCFNVSRYSCSGDLLTVEVVSGHALANGVFKDLADAVIDALNTNQLRLRSGVINRVHQNPLGSLLGVLTRNLSRGGLIAGAAVVGVLIGLSLLKIAGGTQAGGRLVPVMYFHREVVLDLFLASRSRRIAVKPAMESN